MPCPALIDLPGAPHEVLPPGVHWVSLIEMRSRFATNPRRRRLQAGIENVAAALASAGCRCMYVDGSYVTSKPNPGDFDGCWDPAGVVASKLDPVLLDFSSRRAAQKAKYFGEMFIATSRARGALRFLDFFQRDKHTGLAKGILGVRLHASGPSP